MTLAAEPPRLRVVEPGLATTLQDLGRPGFGRIGVSTSGALDRDALALANALVGAPDGAAALEMRLTGPRLAVEADSVRVAVVGAAARLTVSGDAQAAPGDDAGAAADVIEVGPGLWRSLRLQRGQTLNVGPLSGSATAYLAVEGGFDAPEILGSRSTFLRAGFGGFGGALAGRPLAAGDQLALTRRSASDRPEHVLTGSSLIEALGPGPIAARVVLGPQDERFDAASIERFLSTPWRISPRSDRMGLRLEGPALSHVAELGGADITSDGLLSGAIQTPANGQPIVLLADRQTAGGYAKIACVISADLGALGRARPGDRVRFAAISSEAAVKAARDAAERRRAALSQIAELGGDGRIDPARLYGANLITALLPDIDT